MRRLILFRHAKSSWADPGVEDHDRPLNQRGRLCATLMGAWLADTGCVPDHALCSSSARTRETWARARRAIDGAPEAEIAPGLYHADPATMLETLRAAPDAARTVVMIGHQPGIGAFVRRMASPDAPAACARAYGRFPTAAVAVLGIDAASWRLAAFGAARFETFAIPGELV